MWQARQCQVFGDTFTDFGQCFTKGNHATIFRLVAHLAPARMIAVLLTPFRVTPRRLNVSIWPGAYPYIGPGRWYTERANTFQFFLVVNWFSIKANVAKVFTNPLTPNAGAGIADVAQTSCFSHYYRVKLIFTRHFSLFFLIV